jgi:hypothetical protein
MRTLELPAHVAARAYVSPGSGEFAWKRGDLPEAMQALVRSGMAILGGEVWVVESPESNWSGLVPSSDNSPPGVWSWDTAAQMPDETWDAYCQRTLQESLESVARMNVEAEAAEHVRSLLWFNVTSVHRNDV